ncbi:MAG: GNAT family N-acetyltransferase [Acidimicrobiia bacterium]
MTAIVELERLAVRALPAVESTTLDGWHLPFGRGQVRRMNAVTTFGIVSWDTFEAVETIERRYGSRRRPVIFRLTALDAELDDLLFARGYEKSDEVAVMTAPATGRPDDAVSWTGAVTPGWLDTLQRLGEYTEARVAELGESLSGMTLPHAAFRAGVGATATSSAVGLAVLDSGWVGLFDIAVDPERRRRGLGTTITSAMLSWGAERGATSAYLQVLADNAPGVNLYAGMGFSESHRYWYRTLDR